MRILFLAPQPFYRLRGMCIAQKRILEALSGMGAEVDVLTFPFGEDVRLPGVRILRLPRPPGIRDVAIGPSWRKLVLDLLLLARAAALCARRRYAAVHACEESIFLAALLKPFFGFRLLYDMDDVLSRRVERSGFMRWEPGLRLLRRLEAWALRSSDLVLTNSPDTTEHAGSLAGGDRVVFYDHMPQLPQPEELPGELAQSLRDACDLDHQRVILYAGNLESYQGVDLLLKSLPEVLRCSPRTCCVVIGGEEPQIAALKDNARKLGVEAHMRWLGKRPIPETLRYMRIADVLVCPMTQEKAIPMKLYAYMASGVPIVATDIPSHRHMLDFRSAVMVRRDPSALADGILTVFGDPASSRKFGERAFRTLRRLGEWNPEKTVLPSVYRRLLGP